MMGLFKPDLYRNFAIGFALGALLVTIQAGPQLWGGAIPHAQAMTGLAEAEPVK